MDKTRVYSFLEGIKKLAKIKKPDERIVVDVYNPYGDKLNSDDEI